MMIKDGSFLSYLFPLEICKETKSKIMNREPILVVFRPLTPNTVFKVDGVFFQTLEVSPSWRLVDRP